MLRGGVATESEECPVERLIKKKKHYIVPTITVAAVLIVLLLDLVVRDFLRSPTVRVENLGDQPIARFDILQGGDPAPVTTLANIPGTSVASCRSSIKQDQMTWMRISFADGTTTADSLGMVSGVEIGEVVIQVDDRSIKHVLYRPLRRHVQHIILLAIALVLLLFYIPKVVRRYYRQKKRLCLACGYDLRASFDLGCPECGWRRREKDKQQPA